MTSDTLGTLAVLMNQRVSVCQSLDMASISRTPSGSSKSIDINLRGIDYGLPCPASHASHASHAPLKVTGAICLWPIRSFLMGSTSTYLLQHSPLPVLILPLLSRKTPADKSLILPISALGLTLGRAAGC